MTKTRIMVDLPAVKGGRFMWATLVQREPRLEELRRRAVALRGGLFNEEVWCSLKRQLTGLVGWNTLDPMLGSQTAYDLAYQIVLAAYEGQERVA